MVSTIMFALACITSVALYFIALADDNYSIQILAITLIAFNGGLTVLSYVTQEPSK